MPTGKTALVTSSTIEIGLGIAKAFAAQGAHVVLSRFGDSEGPKAKVAALNRPRGGRVVFHGTDMGKPTEIEAMMKFAAEQFGQIDILVNNAGIQHVVRIEDFRSTSGTPYWPSI